MFCAHANLLVAALLAPATQRTGYLGWHSWWWLLLSANLIEWNIHNGKTELPWIAELGQGRMRWTWQVQQTQQHGHSSKLHFAQQHCCYHEHHSNEVCYGFIPFISQEQVDDDKKSNAWSFCLVRLRLFLGLCIPQCPIEVTKCVKSDIV